MTVEIGHDGSQHRIAVRQTVDPARLSPGERNDLCARLYTVHRQIFAGVPETEFRAHVLEPDAERTAVQIYFGRDDEVVGYCAVHRFRRCPQGRTAIVLRIEAGLRPEYRGCGATHWFSVLRFLAEKLRRPLTPVYYLGTLVHPSGYHVFCKYFPQVYPHPDHGTPDRIRAIMLDLADSFADPAVDAADPLIRDVGWVTIKTAPESGPHARRDFADTRYFEKRNPGYASGHGLLVLVPITFAVLTAAITSLVLDRVRLALTRSSRRP